MYQQEFAVEKMCKVLGVARSSYYAWLERKPSARVMETIRLMKKIGEIYHDNKGRYGSPKITDELNEQGFQASRPRIGRMMKKMGLRSITRKKYRVATTDSNHGFRIAENILKREFYQEEVSKAWVSDITYVPTAEGWLYLTIIMDLFDRKIVGWSLSEDLTTEATIIPAWQMAKTNRPVAPGLIFHSDRGVQYAADSFRKELEGNDVVQSMSRKGNCWDNAVAENFFKIIKSEMIYHYDYRSVKQAKSAIFEFIEVWYNRKRKHAYLGYKTPEAFSNFLNMNAA
jgi:transposase InsO family protein